MRIDVAARTPEEACGLLAGVGLQGMLVYPITNVLHSAVRFRMEPVEQIRAFYQMETEKQELLAIYHSHPDGPAYPSETDLKEFAYPGVAMIIWSPGISVQDGWQARGFRIEGGTSSEIALEIMPPG